MAFLTLGTGAVMTVKLGFFQLTHIKNALVSPFAKTHTGAGTSVSPFQALATALGGSIGTANIAGVAGALITGGPGALFWMWAAGAFGMSLKTAEIVLAIKYRDSSVRPPQGGPMHYMLRGLGKKAAPLAFSYAFFGSAAAMIGTALVQSNTIAESSRVLFGSVGLPISQNGPVVSGIVTAGLTGAVIFGGAKRIGRFSAAAVPIMAVCYASAALLVIAKNIDKLPDVVASVFSGALGIRQAAGGAAGYGIMRTLRIGAARGVYSNEAGVGSSAMAHAATAETDPVKQSLLGVFEVFADTFVMCTLTAFAVLSSGALAAAPATGMEAAFLAFGSVLGDTAASIMLSACVLMFAFTSLVGWELYGETCASFLFGGGCKNAFRLIFLLFIPIGAILKVDLCWKLGEQFNYLMALPNLTALLLLSGKVSREISAYKMFEKKHGKRYNKG